MKSLFNRLAGVAVVGVVLYSCASIVVRKVVLLMKPLHAS